MHWQVVSVKCGNAHYDALGKFLNSNKFNADSSVKGLNCLIDIDNTAGDRLSENNEIYYSNDDSIIESII